MYSNTFRNNSIGHVKAKSSNHKKKESFIAFGLLLFYLLLEYGRPQELLPFLRVLHLPGITIGLLALCVMFSGKIQFKDKQTVLFLFLLGLMVIHGPIAVNNYWALMVFIAMVMNFIVFLSINNFVNSTEKYEKLMKIWVMVHIFLSIIGFIKQGKGIGGSFGDENDFCMVLNMIIPIVFFQALSESGKRKIFYTILTCLFLFVIILTKSRGGFVGLIATCAYCWSRSRRKAMTALIMGSLALFAVLVAPSAYWDEVRSIGEQGTTKGTGSERIYTWGIGWHMFLNNPIMGVGQGNFPWAFKEYEFEVTGSDEPFQRRSLAGRQAHSIYFTMLPELGIIGTTMILWMIFIGLKGLKYVRNVSSDHMNKAGKGEGAKYYYLALGLEGSLVAYLVSGAFISILYYPSLWILLGFVISLKKIVVSKMDDMQLSPGISP